MNKQITSLLQRLEEGEREALDDLMPLVYEELKRLASRHLRREGGPVPLGTTALVHEAFLKLAKGRHPSYKNRAHFYGIVSRLMRQILVDAARRRTAEKRVAMQEIVFSDLPDWTSQPDRSVLAVNGALKQLEQTDPVKAKIIELSYFGGFTAEEISLTISKPVHAVRRELRLARAWLRKEISGADTAQESGSSYDSPRSAAACSALTEAPITATSSPPGTISSE